MYEIHMRSLPWILVILCVLPCDVNAAQKVLDCGGNFTAASGIIQSPGHPGNYTNNQDCVYVIRRPQRERITLTFEQLDMPGRGVECTEDFLEIRDGYSANYPILARVCNTSLPSPKKTFQNNMWIRFRSNGAMTGRGFRASYTSGIMKETFLFIASSSGNIFDMDVESGSRTALPLPGLNKHIAVDYDPVEGRLYWTDMTIRQIKSIYLNGSGIRSFSFSANAKLVGMAVDPLSRLVFYTDESNAVIGMIGISGTPHKTVISTNLEKPRAIVLDTINGVMFWTDWGIPAKIERANYDGTDRRRLHRYNLIIPTALAVDLKNNRLYWADAGTDLVEWSNLDGTSRRELYRAKGHAHFFGMTYYDNKFYVTDWSILGPNITKNYIHILSTDGSMAKTDVSDPGILRGIHMYVEDGWQRGPNGCVYNNGGCSHICIPASGNSSKCLCPDAPTTCREGIMKDTFFFLVNYLGNIFVFDVENGSRTVLPIPGLENPYAVDYDPVEGRLYWTDLTINQISSAYLNGSGIRSLKVFNANALLTGMAVDPLSRLVFYTDMGNGVIGVMGLSGTPHKTVISTDLDRPRAIVLDTMNGVMFWTDIGTPEKIERANYDGTDRKTLHSYSLYLPNALAVDLKNNRLYWADMGTDLVEWSDLDGTRRTQLYKARGDAHFLGMTFYNNMLYVTDFPTSWSNTSKGYLHILSTDGSMGERVVSVPGTLGGMHMYVEDGWQRGPNGCGYNNGGCSHICIPASENSSKCLCPDTPTVCREVSGASTTTQPVTSSTSTSTSPPIEVTIRGPTLFDTDGSVTITLTCDPENLKRVRSVTWSVTCTMKVDRKCLWTPRTPRDDGKVVTCSITYMDGQSGVGSFRVQLNSTQQVLDCGGNFTAASGTIQYPVHPGNYKNNLDCIYVIRRPQGERITLTFERLDMPGRGDECTEDFLEIRDGDSVNSSILARVCNTSLPSPKKTLKNKMWIRFRSDGAMTGRGFRTYYTSGIIKKTFLFIANFSGNIIDMDLESGSRTVLPIPGLNNPWAVDYDPVEGRLYWTDYTVRQLPSAYLNGSGIRSLRVFNANALLAGMAVDPLSRLVFYTDEGNGVIGMMGLSGTPHKTVIRTNLDKPRAIVLDTMNGVMFWTDWGTPEKIERANYDGTDRRTLHSYSLIVPAVLAVDLKNNRLYWADAATDLVEWSDLDGTSRMQLYKATGAAHFTGMTYYDNMLYVTDCPTFEAKICNLHILSTDGSMGERVVSVPGRPYGIHMYVEDGWQRGPNGCGYNNGGCSHICIPASGNSSKCLCPDTPTVCSEVSGSSTTTQKVTSTTSTSTSPPVEVTIQGPTLFDTDGSMTMTLKCDPENMERVRFVTWSVTCTTKVGRKCTWTPRTPGDDGKVVTCSITYMDGQSGVGSFRVQLNYPPSAPPTIHGYKTGDLLQAGDSLIMTCLVRDGKPLVTSVIFSCPGHPDNAKDIRDDFEVESLVVINPLRASDNGVRCVCTADWKRSEWYALSATRVLSVAGTISLPAEAAQQNTGYIVGGAVGGGAFLLVVVVIIVVVICRRGGRNYETHASDFPAPDVEMYPFARVDEQGFLGNPCPARPPAADKNEDTNSTYAKIVE